MVDFNHIAPQIDHGPESGARAEGVASTSGRSPRPAQPGPLDATDTALARLAARQHGNVTRRQLLALGVSANAITHRFRTGRLHPVFRGVYAVGHRPPSPLARASGAVLACGSGAVLSHGSAATLWGIDQRWRYPLEVTARSKHRRAGIKVHRSGTLGHPDVTEQFGIAVTSPARTALDLSARLTDSALARSINDARLAGHLKLSDLAELLNRLPGHPQFTRLEPFVVGATAPTRSHFEDAFLAFTRRFALPRPELNQFIAGYEVDILYREHKLVIELDGYEYHGDRTSFEQNRERDAELLAAGLSTMRITWDRFTLDPAREAARLHSILADRPTNPPPRTSARTA